MATVRRYPFFDPAHAVKLRGGVLAARYPVAGTTVGHHASRQRGWSTEFAEHRPYVAGDDLRHLDWKVYGRTGKRYIRQYEDERTRHVYLVLDHSRSMAYRGWDAASVATTSSPRSTAPKTAAASGLAEIDKLTWSRACLAYLAWVAVDRADPTTIIPVADHVGSFYPPGAHPAHFYRLLDQLAQLQPAGGTSLARAFQLLAHRLRPTGLVVIVSDFLTPFERLMGGVQRLQQAGHDVWLIQVLDRTEWEFPFERPLLFTGLEGEAPVRLPSGRVGEQYRRSLQRFCQRIADWTHQRHIRYRRVLTDEDPSTVVAQWVQSRNRRESGTSVANPSAASSR